MREDFTDLLSEMFEAGKEEINKVIEETGAKKEQIFWFIRIKHLDSFILFVMLDLPEEEVVKVNIHYKFLIKCKISALFLHTHFILFLEFFWALRLLRRSNDLF